MEGKKKTASGTEKEAALAELDRVERELAELGPDPALEADKKSNAVLDKGKTRPLKEVKYPVAVSASELKKMEIPQIVWIVDRLLPVGVSMIGAPSKYFKSSKVRRTAMLNGELLPAKKPDIDNIVKAVLDALNEVAYRDDTQVVELQVRKQYSERPRLEICNERLEEFLSFEKGKDQEGRSKEYFAYQMFAGH